MPADVSNGNEGVGESGQSESASEEVQDAWISLLDRLERSGRLEHKEIREAMETYPRWRFLPGSPGSDKRRAAVKDSPVAIGDEQTISAPHMVAILLEAGEPTPGERCLEIGAGSGWLATLLGDLVAPEGTVVGVEIVPDLVELARTNVQVGVGNVEILMGDGSLGHPEGGPYNLIIVSCGAPSIPEPLKKQLALGGRLVIPVGQRGHQRLIRVTRTADGYEQEDLGGCAFVPLVGQHGF